MVNQQTLQGSWNEVKGKLRTKWGQLTNDELQTFDGNVERLIGLIQRKTGEGRSAIESFLEQATADGSSAVSRATAVAGEYAKEMAEKVQETSQQAAESVRRGYEEAEKMVKQRPAESIAICFGAGVLAGLMLGLILRSR
jgi:uncharacterized protein YjbJ (UPF0337 family)